MQFSSSSYHSISKSGRNVTIDPYSPSTYNPARSFLSFLRDQPAASQDAQTIFAVASASTALPGRESETYPRIQQALLIIPLIAAGVSFIIYLIWTPSDAQYIGKIGLPVTSGEALTHRQRREGYEDDDDEEYQDGEEEKKDPFDIQDEELEIDGYPVNEGPFWKKVMYAKIALLATLVPPFVINVFNLVYFLIHRSAFESASRDPALPFFFPADYFLETICILIPIHVFLLSLSAYYLTMNGDVKKHWVTTVHLTSVLFMVDFCQILLVLFPSSAKQGDVFNPLPGQPRELRIVQILGAIQPILLLIPLVIAGTISRGPALYFPMRKIFTSKTMASLEESVEGSLVLHDALNHSRPNVTEEVSNSFWGAITFSYATSVIWKGWTKGDGLDVWDLPIVKAELRTLGMYRLMTRIYGETQKKRKRSKRANQELGWAERLPVGWSLLWKVLKANWQLFSIQTGLAAVTAVAYYAPAFFLNRFVGYLEDHPDRSEMRWGWLWSFALFSTNMIMYITIGLLWSISSTQLQTRIKLQLNTILFRKTLVKKDLAATAKEDPKTAEIETITPALPAEMAGTKQEQDQKMPSVEPVDAGKAKGAEDEAPDDEDVSSKSQIMTLFTVDVDRVAEFVFHFFTLVDAPIEIIFAVYFLQRLLGPSALIGLVAAIITVPINHYASKFVVSTQDRLMAARDSRVALMNEILGAIRMVKFMAWERSFEKRVNEVRDKELKELRRNYIIETALNLIYALTPVIVTVTAFLHYVLVLHKPLTPSIAFTAVSVFSELRFALTALPETFIQALQGFVSLRRIEKYMSSAEVEYGQGDMTESQTIAFNSATITWPRDVAPPGGGEASAAPSRPATPSHTPKPGFTLTDLTLQFPQDKLSLICGKLGSGKTLLLLGLLGEADVLAGQVLCPRSVPNAMDDYGEKIADGDWIKDGTTAYAPQIAWLRNASIKENILFGAPWDERRYNDVLAACSLVSDLAQMEDHDETEVGEKGLNLSGGQKQRVSLARAVYSRAHTLLLDDILSAVDAHTSAAIMQNLFQGDLVSGRTIILVSHHVQLVSPIASFIVALENGDLTYAGDRDGFIAAGLLEVLEEDVEADKKAAEQNLIDKKAVNKRLHLTEKSEPNSETSSLADTDDTAVAVSPAVPEKKKARKLVEDEQKATGGISRSVWSYYFNAQGKWIFWAFFVVATICGALPPLLENQWLRVWSGSYSDPDNARSPQFYVLMYALITSVGTLATTARFGVLYLGGLAASKRIHNAMLTRILLATIRFHDTSSRGRILNRFAKDIERIDSDTADNFGRTLFYGLNIVVTFGSITWVGGWQFAVAAAILACIYFYYGKIYNVTSRDLRRLDSTSRSPLYSTYSEVISGIQVVRAFGASSKIMGDMFKIADSNTSCFIWYWSSNRWISTRYNILSSIVVGLTAVVMLIAGVPAAAAGFALAFANTCSNDLLFVARRYVALEQSMVTVERLKEYTELPLEAPEYIEPRPAAAWPTEGAIEVKNLVIRYAPELPNVLHQISFKVNPHEKIGIVGATGSGKSTLALCLFRFVELTEGSITIDGMDITDVGLTDLRRRVVIIPQDPTILSGSLRSTLDVFDEYEDHEIFAALRSVHLLKSAEEEAATPETSRNQSVFKDLNSPVAEGGDNFSLGEKQLICLARAILKRSKILVMDEATASIDYATDELIQATLATEFANSTVLTIAHRLHSVIGFDRILVIEKGNIAEFDTPATLLRDHNSKFYGLCKATGSSEFKALKFLANEKERKEKGDVGDAVVE